MGIFFTMLSSLGFKVETDIGINERFVPFGISGRTTGYRQLGLISDGSDELFFCGCF